MGKFPIEDTTSNNYLKKTLILVISSIKARYNKRITPYLLLFLQKIVKNENFKRGKEMSKKQKKW